MGRWPGGKAGEWEGCVLVWEGGLAGREGGRVCVLVHAGRDMENTFYRDFVSVG